MQLELELQPQRRHALLLASSPEAGWQGAAKAWFRHAAANAWSSELPAVVVVPTRGQIQALKGRMLEAGLSALGLEFVTPPYLRALLAARSEIMPAAREHLHFLLALAAEQLLADEKLPEAERLAAISVRRTPDHLLRLLEQLNAAGAEFEQIDLPAFRPVARKFRALLKATAFEIFPEADRRALAHARQNAPALGELLITGFHGGHWQLWHLLEAAARSSQRATVILQNPREEAHDLDAAWIGTWEETLGEAQTIVIDSEANPAERSTIFLAGLDTREQVEAIAAAAHQFLGDENCTRLGVVFPANGALPRLVASALSRHGLAHYDAMGQMAPGLFEAPDFWSWMELQRTPRLNVLLRFLTALPNDQSFLQDPSRDKIGRALQRALGDIAIDDLALLVAAARERDRDGDRIFAALENVLFLPDKATFAEFLQICGSAFALLGWNERWREIAQLTAWTGNVEAIFSRTLFLQWLDELAVTVRITRDVLGQHPYARIQLLTPAQAENQSWSHLILCGLNEGSWPAGARGDFLPAVQIEALNKSVQKINRAATKRGSQGEGHSVVRDGATLFLGAEQQRQLSRAQFDSLLESATHGIALIASLVQEAAPERLSNPSEFFGRVYHEIHGQPISQANMRTLREETRRWLDGAKLILPNEQSETAGIFQTRAAYLARRTSEPANEYDFALRSAPDEIEPLSVSDTEALLKSPALIWMERFLGVQGAEDPTYVWNATIGKWTHDWLAAVFGPAETFVALPTEDEFANRIGTAAERKRAEVLALCRLAGRTIPDWWESGWENALCLAQTLGLLVGAIEGWKWAAAEWRLKAQPIAVGENHRLLLSGQADLLLGKTAALPTSLALPELWIVDFKTGNKKSLAPKGRKKDEPRAPRVLKSVLKGDALQLALYTLAAKQLAAQSVEVSILSPIIAKPEPQLRVDDFADCGPAFRELARMQATGIFGMKGPLRSAFTFTRDYPLATLSIDPEIIDERWELTHPDLALEEESW
ncbi:MAG TPA: PD-(D/E)XK nuclease family protein [Chthoniobacterales bacterium]|nr:PD-(D/E)XK nuclease family protein [Chthoniobacterales bacterium]